MLPLGGSHLDRSRLDRSRVADVEGGPRDTVGRLDVVGSTEEVGDMAGATKRVGYPNLPNRRLCPAIHLPNIFPHIYPLFDTIHFPILSNDLPHHFLLVGG